MSIEALPQVLGIRRRSALSGHDDEVERCQVELPEGFARDAFESVSIYSPFRRSARDSQPQARALARARCRKHGEEAVGGSMGVGEDSGELL